MLRKSVKKNEQVSFTSLFGIETILVPDSTPLIYVKVKLFNKELNGMIDTGATLSAISS